MTDNKETAGEMLQRLGANGKLWAEEFNKTAVKLGYSEMDEGWLIGWFANAIENTCATRRCYSLTEERDRLREALEFYANPEIYKPHPHGPAFDRRDLSFHARAALSPPTAEGREP